MKQTTKRFTSMVMALLLIVAALMLYFNFIEPAYADAQRVKADELSKQQFLANEQSAIQQVQNLISTYESQGQVRQAVSLALPTSQDIAGALAQINGIAGESSMQLQSVQVSAAPVQQVAQSQQTGQAATPFSALLKQTGTVTFQAKLTGTYEDFKNFLSLLETNMRIFDVKGISVSENAAAVAAGAQKPVDLYDFDLSIDAYYQIQ